jgi:hypothetical protein
VANLTLAIADDLLREARKLAGDRDTTVNQMVREFLEKESRGASAREQAKARLMKTRYPGVPSTWTRGDSSER